MRHQAIRTTALMLGVLLLAAAPAQAGTVTFGDLVRTVGASGQLRPASEVRLRLGARAGSDAAQSGQTQSGTSSPNPDQQQAPGSQPSNPTGSTSSTPDPTLSQSGSQVETVDLGDVTGTVCDCGEIPPINIPRAGGFPWWPLLGGAIIPFIIPRGDDENPPDNPPPPPPTQFSNRPNPQFIPPNPIPEPTSLLLFGSGLLAAAGAARRRYGRRREEELNPSATSEEV